MSGQGNQYIVYKMRCSFIADRLLYFTCVSLMRMKWCERCLSEMTQCWFKVQYFPCYIHILQYFAYFGVLWPLPNCTSVTLRWSFEKLILSVLLSTSQTITSVLDDWQLLWWGVVQTSEAVGHSTQRISNYHSLRLLPQLSEVEKRYTLLPGIGIGIGISIQPLEPGIAFYRSPGCSVNYLDKDQCFFNTLHFKSAHCKIKGFELELACLCWSFVIKFSLSRAPSFTKLGMHILQYLRSHILALLEQDANVMHE